MAKSLRGHYRRLSWESITTEVMRLQTLLKTVTAPAYAAFCCRVFYSTAPGN